MDIGEGGKNEERKGDLGFSLKRQKPSSHPSGPPGLSGEMYGGYYVRLVFNVIRFFSFSFLFSRESEKALTFFFSFFETYMILRETGY